MKTMAKMADLRAFCAVVDEGSMTAAARALDETKGSVSRRISRLERNLDTALIHRVGGKAQPTPLGRSYYRRAGEALELLDAAAEELRDQAAAPSGHLRVTALPGVGARMIAGPIGRFLEAFPGVTIETSLTERLLSFREDHIDFAFRPVMGQLPDSTLIAHVLTKMSVGFVASPAYLNAHGTPTHPDQLHQHRLLLPPVVGRGLRLPMQRVGQPETAAVFEFTGNLLCHDTRLLFDSALAGGGITPLMPDRDEPEIQQGLLVRLFPEWESSRKTTFALLHPAGPMTPKAKAFKDFIKADFAELIPFVR
jgi:DNA-binding transcriptional LysR family regulator